MVHDLWNAELAAASADVDASLIVKIWSLYTSAEIAGSDAR
jgi:hypothetical protein